MPSRHNDKIFCIGWPKTGTSTMNEALTRLGYKVSSWSDNLVCRWHEGNFDVILSAAKRKDAFEDLPWPLVYREMDRAFPNARFILTTRASEAVWLESARRHFARYRRRSIARFLIYGTYEPSARVLAAKYREHNIGVRNYFAGRPGKLLELCFEHGDGWAPLCRFLGIDQIPEEPFPHANKGPEAQPRLHGTVDG
jgi:Sulfotransferase domain